MRASVILGLIKIIPSTVFSLCMFSQQVGFLAYPVDFACFSSFSTVSVESAFCGSRLGKSSIACWWAGLPSFARLNLDSLWVWKRRGWSMPLFLTFLPFLLSGTFFHSQTLICYFLNLGYFLSFIFSARNITDYLVFLLVFIDFTLINKYTGL